MLQNEKQSRFNINKLYHIKNIIIALVLQHSLLHKTTKGFFQYISSARIKAIYRYLSQNTYTKFFIPVSLFYSLQLKVSWYVHSQPSGFCPSKFQNPFLHLSQRRPSTFALQWQRPDSRPFTTSVRESHVPSSNEPRGSQSQAETHPCNVGGIFGTTYQNHTEHINLAKYLHLTTLLLSQQSTSLSCTTWFKIFFHNKNI
jgi:hypothetical protein